MTAQLHLFIPAPTLWSVSPAPPPSATALEQCRAASNPEYRILSPPHFSDSRRFAAATLATAQRTRARAALRQLPADVRADWNRAWSAGRSAGWPADITFYLAMLRNWLRYQDCANPLEDFRP